MKNKIIIAMKQRNDKHVKVMSIYHHIMNAWNLGVKIFFLNESHKMNIKNTNNKVLEKVIYRIT